jgi:Exopolysaccharide synthesis, ExoD
MAVSVEFANDFLADKSSGSGDENFHRGLPLRGGAYVGSCTRFLVVSKCLSSWRTANFNGISLFPVMTDSIPSPLPLARASLLETICLLRDQAPPEGPTIAEILVTLHGRGQAMLIFILAVPFCLPLPLVGVSTPFGVAIIFLGLRVAFGQHPWLPGFLMKRRVPRTLIEQIIKLGTPFMKRVEKILHPRLP